MTRLAMVVLMLISTGAWAQDVAPGRVALRAEQVDATASKRLGRVQRCYEKALETAPRSYGTIGVGFRISPDGAVTERFVALSTLGDPALETCILESFDGVRFPAPGAFGAVARFGVLLKTRDSPAAALATQEAAYRRAIRDLPAVQPELAPRPRDSRLPPGFEGLDDREPIGPIDRPDPNAR